jgi:hypothetical protein
VFDLSTDNCGECGGNNSTCEQFYNKYDTAMEGYRTVARIPKGAFNIDIRQDGDGSTIDNYLGKDCFILKFSYHL